MSTSGDIARLLNPPRKGPPRVVRRVGTVDAVNADGTLNITIAGVALTSIPRLASYGAPAVGDQVIIDIAGSDLLVIGTPATS